jgi:hypothetical protein
MTSTAANPFTGMFDVVAPLPAVEEERKRKAETFAAAEQRKKAKAEMRYRTKTAMTDLTLTCADGELYFSKWQAARDSSMMEALLEEDPELKEIQLKDYDCAHVELGLRYMDTGLFCSNGNVPASGSAAILYKLAHYWGFQKMEDKAGELAMRHMTYQLLGEMKDRSYAQYPQALKKFMETDAEAPPLVRDIVAEYWKVRATVKSVREEVLRLANEGYAPKASLQKVADRLKF